MTRLPKHSTAIIDRTETEDAQRVAMARTNAGLISKKKERRGECETRAQYLRKEKQAGRLYREKITVGEDGRQTVEKIPDDTPLRIEEDEIASLDQQIELLSGTSSVSRMTAARLRKGIDPNTKYVTELVAPKLGDGEDKADALSRVRDTIDVLKFDLKGVMTAVLPLREVRDAAMAQVDALAARGCPKVGPAFQGRPVEFPMQRVPNPGSNGLEWVTDGAALVAFLFNNELKRKIDTLLQANATEDSALSELEQREKIDSFNTELDSLYRQETALVESIIAEGGNAFHFADRPVLAVLGLRAA